MTALPEKFIARMRDMLGADAPAFFAEYEKQPVRGVRVNTLKIPPEELLPLLPFGLEPSGILPEGFIFSGVDEAIGRNPYHIAGLFYMQEPSAMSPIGEAEIEPGMRVLDLCAAPGGKSGGIAARMKGEGLLVSNEIVPNRARILSYTMERLGVCSCAVTCAHPESLCASLPEYFDRVIVDAPCSGEGMFRKDETAIAEWSVEHVQACAARQRAILQSAYKALRPGGKLIYSTCTFSKEENEDTAAAFMAEHKDMELELMMRLYPNSCAGEGHFVARMKKAGEGGREQPDMMLAPCKERDYLKFIGETFTKAPEGKAYLLKDGRVIILRSSLPEGLSKIRLLGAGIYAGDIQRRFIPAHSLFMAAHGGEYSQKAELTGKDIQLFLSGNTVNVDDALRGYMPAAVKGYPVGFGKAVDGVLKNHIPKGLRIF